MKWLFQFRPKSRRFYETLIENFLSKNRKHEKFEGKISCESAGRNLQTEIPLLDLEGPAFLRSSIRLY